MAIPCKLANRADAFAESAQQQMDGSLWFDEDYPEALRRLGMEVRICVEAAKSLAARVPIMLLTANPHLVDRGYMVCRSLGRLGCSPSAIEGRAFRVIVIGSFWESSDE